MKNILFALLFVLGLVSCQTDNGAPTNEKRLVAVVAEVQRSKEVLTTQLSAELGFDVSASPFAAYIKDLDIASITYNTKGVDGKPVIASGIVVMLNNTASYGELLSIQHSTIDIDAAPSKGLFSVEMMPVFAGKIVVMADYLGYGVSQTPDLQHPYLHHISTGVACADMIYAANEYLVAKGVKQEGDKLSLMGYSQGAAATVSTLMELEKRGQKSRIKSVQAGAGPYDLISALSSFISSGEDEYPGMGFVPFLIRGMNYGDNLKLLDDKIYTPELIANGSTKMFANTQLSKWHSVLGTDIKRILHADFFKPNFNNNIDISRFAAALLNNSLVAMQAEPQSLIQLYHSQDDEMVSYENSIAATEVWENVTLTDLTTKGHASAGLEFMLRCMGLWSMMEPSLGAK